MNVIRAASELKTDGRKVCLAIGMFDGVHLGHQQVIRQTLADAEQQEALAVVITFDRHPNTVVASDRVPLLIYSLPQKLSAIELLAVDTTLLIHFDKAFSQLSGEEFVRRLAKDFGQIHCVCVGSTFTFGHKRTGNVDLLRRLGEELHFQVHGLAAVSLDGQIVSSTRIREAIRAGQLNDTSQMLGREYALAGKVTRGDGIGRRLGVPTANIDVTGLALPPHGVWAVHAYLGEQRHRAVLNIGYRPTLQNPSAELRVEAHLLDFVGELYERELEITFVEKLRDEQKFGSLDALREQIQRDIAEARKCFASVQT
jgi:riboflavin kinase / FMN adenylyltransferase